MQLYNLVEFRKKLSDSLEELQSHDELANKIALVQSIQQLYESVEHHQLLNGIIEQYQQQINKTQEIADNVKSIADVVDNSIDQLARELFDVENYRNQWTEEGLSQDVVYPADVEFIVGAKITNYSNWNYPCLQINPRHPIWINYMVAGDPLYLTGHHIDQIENMIAKYPSEYQRRLRLYETLDRDFSQLPKEQMGFVLCWENFNYLSSEKVDIYLEKVLRLLRPGGVFMFSYNNCDIPQSAYATENQGYSFNSSRQLKSKALHMGYEIVEFVDLKPTQSHDNYISWAEIKKPGELNTIKRSQSLALIHEK
jgi:SAM-dependent methyltransferase